MTEEERAALRAYRKLFQAGRRFRVAAPGCRLTGMQPHRTGGRVGWGLSLAVGDELTCAGTSMTSGDGVPAVKWWDALGRRLAEDCLFEPVIGGMWGGQYPVPGRLEPLDGPGRG
jgi:hypothetical protein